MDHQKIQSKSQYVKKVIKFIFYVSLISFIFTNSSLLPFLVQSFNHNFSTIYTYSAERNYMFLIFNGILVFIVKNSGLISNCAALETVEPVKNKGDRSAPELSETIELAAVAAAKEIEQEHQRNEVHNELFAAPEQEDIIVLLSTEELNKKCDEFIRKMKKVIKIEAK